MTSTSIRKKRRFASVWQDAQYMRAKLERLHPFASVCKAPLLSEAVQGEIVQATYNKVWRYYTAFECGDPTARRICLMYKKMGSSAVMGSVSSTDGVNFGNRTDMVRLPSPPWHESMFTHNLAMLALGGGEYAMLGGLQGFVSNTTCRLEQRTAKSLARKRHHAACLQLDRRASNAGSISKMGSTPPSRGIRLSLGRGLPWSSSRWTTPSKVIITGDMPTGCVDRRPPITGYPRLKACQFDGRLSLARGVDGRFLLYARANLKFGVVSGGRFVQVTQSASLERDWSTWQPVSILGIDSGRMDLYFFSVQTNPVDRSSLFALFPLTEPPFACIAFAVSTDGIHFSRPINLRQSLLGVRQTERRTIGPDESALEWRGEDHPAAGAMISPTDPGVILFYVHHAVKGTTVRENATSHVRVYRLAAAEVARATKAGLQELSTTLGFAKAAVAIATTATAGR